MVLQSKSYIKSSTGLGKMSTSKELDYLDEYVTESEAMGPK